MKLLQHWKILLVLALVFAAGAVSGIVGTHLKFKKAFENSFNPDIWVSRTVADLQARLKLTPEQQPKIRAIVEESVFQIKKSFGTAIHETGEIIVQSWSRVDQELTPEQLVIHQKLCQEFREGLKKKTSIELPPAPPKDPGQKPGIVP